MSSPCLVHHAAVVAAVAIPIAAIVYVALWWEPPLRMIPNSNGMSASDVTSHSGTTTSGPGSAIPVTNHNERYTDTMKTPIDRLRIEREGVVKYLDSLDKEIRREETTGAPVEPSWPFAVITFIKVREDDQQPLNYAAIRNGDKWVVTQDSRSNYPQRSRTWDELMRWIGPDEWPTVTVMVEGRKDHVQFNINVADEPMSSDGVFGDNPLNSQNIKLRSQQL